MAENKKTQNHKRMGNQREIWISAGAVGVLFLCLFLYLGHFVATSEQDMINNSYNSRQQILLSRNYRGSIYSRDGEVLAETILNDEEEESRNYPYKNLFSHIVGYSTQGRMGVEAPPEVTTVSGDYEFPINIEVTDGNDVYYTTDGSDPTQNSAVYSGPIPMPLGKSTFRFIRIAEGRKSDIVEKSYNLVMNTDFMPEDAVKKVVNHAIQSGKISEESGSFDESGAAYLYQYQYVTNINKIDDFVVNQYYINCATENGIIGYPIQYCPICGEKLK